jgi:hypothetical protein
VCWLLFRSFDASRIEALETQRSPRTETAMNNASRTPSNATQPDRSIVGALLGALATFVVLTGAVAIAETPQQLSTITESLVSTEVFEFMPSSWIEAPEQQTLAPASGLYEETGLQVTYDRYVYG